MLIMNIFKFLVFLSLVGATYGQLIQEENMLEKLKFCHPNMVRAEYSIDDPVKCVKQIHSHTKSCQASIHRVTSGYKNITMFSCQTTITSWSTVYYFFGSKTKDYK